MRTEAKQAAGQGEIELRLSLPPSLEAVEAACGEIRELLGRCRLRGMSFAVEIVARECLNNAVLHGSRTRRRGGRVELAMKVLATRIRLRIADQGSGFDWRRAQGRGWPAGARTGGRGLMVIRTYAQRVVFNRQGNAVTLWIDRENESE